MGNSWFRRDFAVHTRRRDNNRYDAAASLPLPVDTQLRGALGMFKREAHCMALGRGHVDMKAIYLYLGSSRVARAGHVEGARGTFEVELQDAATASIYDAAEETLAAGRWPLLERTFFRQYTPTQRDRPLHVRCFEPVVR